MAHYLLSAEATFVAAHTLPGVAKCERLHGHNFRARLTIRVEAGSLGGTGIVLDFRLLEEVARHAVDDFDHQYLNDLPAFRESPPTAEVLVRVIADRIAARLAELAPTVKLDQVELWEMPQYRVTYRPE